LVTRGVRHLVSPSLRGAREAPTPFIGAQAINIVWTLLLAYLLFGGVLFAQPDIK
jgi:hypothetical protein